MQTESWRMIFGISEEATVQEELERTPYDELIEIDLDQDICKSIYHTEGKYPPLIEGDIQSVIDYSLSHAIHPDDQHTYTELFDLLTLRDRLAASPVPGMLECECRHVTSGGAYIWTRVLLVSGEAYGLNDGTVQVYLYDIQPQHARAKGRSVMVSKAYALAKRDEVTGLFNEKAFFALAQERMMNLDGQWCVIDINIEHFKLFTDWNGVQSGQQLLSMFGEILRGVAEETNGVAGYRGQDDFCLMIPYNPGLIDDLHEALCKAIGSISQTVGFTPIFGVCLLDAETDQIMEAYNHAALTSDELKGNLNNRIGVYDAARQQKRSEEYRLLVEFQDAIRNHEILFYIQPQCRVGNGKIVGAESLARWRKADGTWVSPALFVPVLEKYGIVTNLDQYIWEEVCKWQRALLDKGIQPVPISVNVSRIDVHTIDVPAFFQMLTEKYRLSPDLIKVEITESAYADDAQHMKETVRRFQEMGFLILMDDFGSGYSSLNMLRTINVDIIKLDAQFLNMDEQEERKGISIIESIVNMTRTLATPVIVEGVENVEQVDFLADLGCRYMQGYYFYRPMPPSKFEFLLSDENNVDHHGIQFKANQQIHAREFMDVNVFTDAMLNNILGPVAFYNWKDDNVDIIRYNQQYFQMTGLDIAQMDQRILHLQDHLYPEDREKFFDLLHQAYTDHLNGAKGIIRIYEPNGVLQWVSIQLYFTSEDEEGIQFYVAEEDVSELQFIDADLPGAYYRCTLEDGFELQHISENFLNMVGFSLEEIQTRFQNRLIQLVHPQDRKALMEQTSRIDQTDGGQLKPYRLLRKQGDYIYVADQSRLTDHFGKICRQGVLIDVTEVMQLRNQMNLLVQYSSSTIVFLVNDEEGPHFHVVVHGLEGLFGMNRVVFERALNDGTARKWVELSDQHEGWEHMNRFLLMQRMTDRSMAEGLMTALRAYFRRYANRYEYACVMRLPGGAKADVTIQVDRVGDTENTTEFILVINASNIGESKV